MTNTAAQTTEKALPEFRAGDTVRVHYKVTEGEKSRIQPYEGIVISLRGEGMSKMFTVRRIGADSVGIERIFPLFSPNIEKLEVVKKGDVRRSKLYYMRDKVGKAAKRVKEAKEQA
jgi:large subunit ribosomal protein L19